MERQKTVLKIIDTGLIATIRTDNAETAERIAYACFEGGVTALEITFNVPGVQNIIYKLTSKFGSEGNIIGAGTVLDPETARIAILSGARFIVAPSLNAETIKLCNRYQVPCIPGAMSVKEVIECMEAGADLIKIFPGEVCGPKIIKAIHGPLPYAPLIPFGGVTTDNVAEWIKAGAMAVGVGSSLIKGAETGDYNAITLTAREFIKRIKKARETGSPKSGSNHIN